MPNSLFVGEESFTKKPEIIHAYTENQYCWTEDTSDEDNKLERRRRKGSRGRRRGGSGLR